MFVCHCHPHICRDTTIQYSNITCDQRPEFMSKIHMSLAAWSIASQPPVTNMRGCGPPSRTHAACPSLPKGCRREGVGWEEVPADGPDSVVQICIENIQILHTTYPRQLPWAGTEPKPHTIDTIYMSCHGSETAWPSRLNDKQAVGDLL